MRHSSLFIMVICTATMTYLCPDTCFGEGEVFELKYEKSGKVYGPFEFVEGEELKLGKAVFTIQFPESANASSERFVLAGYDGVEVGASIDALREELATTPGLVRGEDGAALEKQSSGPYYEYALYRSKHHKTDKSIVRVRVLDGKIVSFEDSFVGPWRWDLELARSVFARKNEKLIAQWGEPDSTSTNQSVWRNKHVSAILEYKDPPNPHDLPSVVLTISARKK